MSFRKNFSFVTYLFFILIITSCSTSRYINILDVKEYSSVKLYLSNGEKHEGIITQKTDSALTLISKQDHQPYVFKLDEVRQIQKSQNNYDLQATPISNAEIEKYKSNRNSWGYAIGGAVLGGVIGIVIDLPLWHANVGIAPFFVGGVTATTGSIYFGFRGMHKDREMAIEKIRYLREQKELENQKMEEERRLEEIKKKAAELKKELSRKDNDEN